MDMSYPIKIYPKPTLGGGKEPIPEHDMHGENELRVSISAILGLSVLAKTPITKDNVFPE